MPQKQHSPGQWEITVAGADAGKMSDRGHENQVSEKVFGGTSDVA